MSRLMHILVFPSQSAFIPGKCISDSVLMLQELVQGYHKEDGVPKATIKVDQAYDMVEWESLWVRMEAMGFSQRFIFLLQFCITKANVSINLNGTLRGWFVSSRGLRQGNPIFSYLFILVLQIFNGLMRKDSNAPGFKFHPNSQQLGITHLSFANDMVLLVLADMDSSGLSKRLLLYLCANLPIPKYVIEEVKKRVRSFLWSGKGEGPYRAKISWNTASLPLTECGLGFKRMYD
ncbi:hypothetical protein LIER_35066 [Lithospermum erythrorhizon]|uniref:Reverse transcriptase domain-containing protein n=1 Tax=Lithospermum erythrorhizon TaxID=34254 RepID=A0AAV3NIX8_LITER